MTLELRGKRIHFMGLGGVGVSAAACIAAARGAIVSGCDREAGPLTESLRSSGIAVAIGHDAAHAAGVDLLVHTAAVPPKHPELLAAGPRLMRRGRFLAELMADRKAVGICGSHGKTTTSWLAGYLLAAGGLDPTVVVGAVVPALNGNVRLGQSEIFLAELDESDESFLLPQLAVAVITNVESDHLSHYGTFARVQEAFRRYAAGVAEKGLLIAGVDDPEAAAIYAAHPGRKLSFGFSAAAEVRAREAEATPTGWRFRLGWKGEDRGWFEVPLLGRHNVLNSLAALTVAGEMGVNEASARSALAVAPGVERRLELLGRLSGARVFSDYAHHPSELKAALAALRAHDSGRLLAVFQPHLFSRTRDYAEEFGAVLAAADLTILIDIYPAREEPLPGVTSQLLVDGIRRSGGRAEGPYALAATGEVVARLASEFDTVAFLGAGDVGKLPYELLGEVRAG